MSVAPAPTQVASPLSRLTRDDREVVIAGLTGSFGERAVGVLAALAGTPEEVAALPDVLQDRAQAAILRLFPGAHGAIVLSLLGIAAVPTNSWLPAVRDRVSGGGIDAAVEAYQALLRGHGSA